MSDEKSRQQDMLNRFAIISIGGRTRILELKPEGNIKWLLEERDFKLFYGNEFITFVESDGNGKPKTKKVRLVDWWITHPNRQQYERLIYDMPGSREKAGAKDFNAYQGFTVKPKAGCWDQNKAFIWDIICNSEGQQIKWVMNWAAAMFQRPGQHAWSSIVLMGGQGIGKGHFADYILGRCFHPQQYIHINGASQLTERFNEHLSGKVFIFADESTWGGDHRAAGRLKHLVTESHIPIERKFLPTVMEPSSLHTVIASNNDWPIPVERDDRRFLVLAVNEDKKQDDAYFESLRKEMDEGGREAMLEELLAMDVDWSLLRHPPGTVAKASLSQRSLKPIEKWWLEILETGNIDGIWPTDVKKSRLHELYMLFLDTHFKAQREPRATATELGIYLSREFGLKPRDVQEKGVRVAVWTLPPLTDMRRIWTVRYNTQGFNGYWSTADDLTPDDGPPLTERQPGDDDEYEM